MKTLTRFISNELLQTILDQHDIVCNQKYGGEIELPYSFHLVSTAMQALPLQPFLSLEDFIKVIKGCLGHDLIEDARLSLNDVKELLGEEVGDIIYACTEEKGRNRKERHSEKFFKELSLNRLAVAVKLCDIQANILFSMLTGSRMFNMYKAEFSTVKYYLYIPGEYDNLWESISLLLGNED